MPSDDAANAVAGYLLVYGNANVECRGDYVVLDGCSASEDADGNIVDVVAGGKRGWKAAYQTFGKKHQTYDAGVAGCGCMHQERGMLVEKRTYFVAHSWT